MPTRGHIGGGWLEIREIGEGGQGVASLVENVETGQVAVRKEVTDFQMIGDTPMEAAILQEILPPSRRIVEMLDVSCVPTGYRDMKIIAWFEYCRGGDLQDAIDRHGRPSEDFIWHCFIQIAEALNHVHNAGSRKVAHRDLKPDNIFLEQKYRPEGPWPNLKLGDFGSAVIEERRHPEQLLPGRASDMENLGAVIYWMGHGEFPPGSPAWRPTHLPRQYSRELSEYMLDCLELGPKGRMSSRILAESLKRDRPHPRYR